MASIIIYTTKEKLEHKKGADGFEYYFWNLPNPPKRLEKGDKIYFATDKLIQGYFICESFSPEGDEMILWHKDSWVELKDKISTRSFQGCKYADKVEGLD